MGCNVDEMEHSCSFAISFRPEVRPLDPGIHLLARINFKPSMDKLSHVL